MRRNLAMAETIKYSFEVRPLSDEDGKGYLVTFPDLPGCMSDGETIEEAIANAMDAEHSWIETAREFGDVIPENEAAQGNTRKADKSHGSERGTVRDHKITGKCS